MFMLKRFLVLLLVLLLCGCGAGETADNTVMIGNPFATHESLSGAETAADMTLTLPEELSQFPAVYRAANNGTLQLLEVLVDVEGNEICLRKSPGTEDNSGVYEEFALAVESPDGERGLVMKGDGDDTYRLAIWQDGEYSYSISCEESVDWDSLYAWVCSTK